ncbi:MAG: glutathione S-transferase family protein [Rhodospirillales bacterium]
MTSEKPVLVIGNKRYSSWSLRPWLALRMAGAQFSETKVLLRRPGETRAEILKHSPSGLVPALKTGGVVIAESLAICEWVNEAYPDAGLWPDDMTARAAARAAAAEMHAGFAALRRDMPMDVCAHRPGVGHSAQALADAARVTEIWTNCRADYGGGRDFLFGRFTIADAMFAPVVSRFITWGVEVDKVSRAYMEAVWSLPPVAEWIAEAETEPVIDQP